MRKINVKIKKGKDLSAKLIKQIDNIFQKAFPGNEAVSTKNKKVFAKDLFFIVYDSKKRILSIGRLRPVKINFIKKDYKIQGIADIVSIKKRKGYGRILMNSIHKYLIKKKQTGVGFCSKKNSPFYKKCNFKIAKNYAKKFWYVSSKGVKKGGDGDVLYLSGKDKFMDKVLKKPKKNIVISRPHR